MMRAVASVAVLAIVTGWSIVPAAQSTAPARRLELKFNAGKVTLIAQGVTVRDVMAEWARQCGCLVQGTERLPLSPMPPVQFEDQPEAVVLESLLRSAGGYLLGPRAAGTQGASIYGSVAVFPVMRGIAAPTYTSSAPIAAPLVTGGSPDDEIPPVTPVTNPQTPAQTPTPPPQPGRPGGPAVPITAGPGQPGSAGSL